MATSGTSAFNLDFAEIAEEFAITHVKRKIAAAEHRSFQQSNRIAKKTVGFCL